MAPKDAAGIRPDPRRGVQRITRKDSTVVGRRALLAAASVAWVYGMAAPTLAAFPGELQAGTRVEVKGRLVGPRTVVADLIEIDTRQGEEDGLGGVIDSVDATAKTLTVIGIKIATSEETALAGESREPIVFADFKKGHWISVDGTLGEDGVLKASEVRIKPAKQQGSRGTKLEGRVSHVDGAPNTFTLLGATVTVTPQTQIVKKRAGGGGE